MRQVVDLTTPSWWKELNLMPAVGLDRAVLPFEEIMKSARRSAQYAEETWRSVKICLL